jgi:hypothetical protein
MGPVIVLAGVGALAVAAAVTLAVLIIGIRRTDRRHLANAPRTHSEALARRLLLGVRYPPPPAEAESPRPREEWWAGK